jgi:hypothetical protein
MTHPHIDTRTPWTLHIDRDGTEDFLIICDNDGNDLVRSEFFWQPYDDEPVSAMQAAVWLMFHAPKLLKALKELAEHADHDCPAQSRSCYFIEAMEQANAVIAKATERPKFLSRHGHGLS